ncbi:hypothetical protein [Pseudobacteriovorax antillogorgiicola]|uniref:hypothetical protein n=1 Tax=Pseudobacteriovorax antillogorgiicola TaxID=1513793 RepID=UPI001A9E162E|nr:hypothetical protein [Pseudobacteriovorax antillogorgiicola]
MCARQRTHLGSESFLWAVTTGIIHLSQGVHLEVRSEGADGESLMDDLKSERATD